MNQQDKGNKFASFLKKQNFINGFSIFCFVFLFLCFFRPQALFYPPYWDSVMGPFTEGIWLFENKFDFVKLAMEELQWDEGGPRVYFTSLYPSYLAFMMHLIKSQRIFLLLNHLLMIGLSSGIISIFFIMLKRHFKMINVLLITALLFFHPMFLSNSYAINMEIPLLFFSLLAVCFFLKEKFWLSGLFSLIAFFVKPTALIVAGSLMFLYVLLYFQQREGKHFVFTGFYSLPICIYLVFLYFSANVFLGHITPHQISPFGIGSYRLLLFSAKWPDIFCFMILVPAGIVVLYKRYRISHKEEHFGKIFHSLSAIRKFLKKHQLESVSVVVCSSLIFVLSSVRSIAPRYFLLGFPFFFILLYRVVHKVSKKNLFAFVFCLALIFYALNMRGGVYYFYRDLLANALKLHQLETIAGYKNSNNGHDLESTLAYENDIELNIELAEHIEKNYSDKKIITNWPISHMLWHSNYGYVKSNNLHVVDLQKSSIFADELFNDVKILNKDEYIWVHVESYWSFNHPIVYNPKKDTLLKKLKKGNQQIIIYQKEPENL